MSFFDKLILSFCRLGVAGLDPKAPGTWGTAIACLLAPYIFLPLTLPWRAALLVAIFVLGGLAATRAEHLLARKDPGEVVIDELVGVWLVLLPFESPSFWLVLAAFAFFRLQHVVIRVRPRLHQLAAMTLATAFMAIGGLAHQKTGDGVGQ